MNNPIPPEASTDSSGNIAAPTGNIAPLVLNDSGTRPGRSILRLLIYFALVVSLWFAGQFLLSLFALYRLHASSLTGLAAGEAYSFAIVFGAALLMSRIEHRPASIYGLPLHSAFGRLFWLGCLVGICEVSSLIGLIALFHGYSFGSLELHGAQILRFAAAWAGVFILVGLFEEFAFRGYTQLTLSEAFGFWPAAIVLSILFGAIHLQNPGEGWVGAAGIMFIGIVFAFALRRTGNLWFVVGLHAAFDFGETFLYSVPDSGVLFRGHLSSATLHGPNWLTGGPTGPEASIFSYLTTGLLALTIHLFFPPRPPDSARPRSHQPPPNSSPIQ